MAVWPSNLPGPQVDSLVVTLGDNLLKRNTQSGRKEQIRYGSGSPDKITARFRFSIPCYESFRTFYERDLNHGTNWFSSLWLIMLGYSDHKAKVQGYPSVLIKHLYYTEVAVDMIVKPSSNCPTDTIWPLT